MPTNVYDVTQPPDTQLANLLGSDLRAFRLDVQQRMALISGTLAGRWNPGTDEQPANWAGLLYFTTDTNQVFQWSGVAWVDVTANILGGTTIARVVASWNLTGQVAAIPATTFYTVPGGAAGLYRLSYNLFITATGGT